MGPCQRRLGLTELIDERITDVGHQLAHGSREQLLLGAEVIVDVARRKPRFFGDPLGRSLMETIFVDRRNRRIDQMSLALITMASLARRCRHGSRLT